MSLKKQASLPLNEMDTLGIHRVSDSAYSKQIIDKTARKNAWEITLGIIFLINITTFLAVALCSVGLGIKNACIYILIAYTIIGLNASRQFYLLKKHPHKKNISLTTETFEDSSIAIALLINATADQAVNPIIAIALVTASIFILTAISAKPFSGFVLSKTLLLLSFIIYAVFFGNQSSGSVIILFPLIVAFIFLFSIGYWLYIRQVKILHLIFLQNNLHEILNEKNKDLDNAHRLRDKIIRHIGHDLRQPINALSYAVFNINANSLSDNQKNQLQVASSSIESANYLIEEILQISTYKKEGTVDVNKNLVPVAVMLDDLKREFSFATSQYELRVAHCSLTLYTDPQLVARILRNFLSNAIRYANGKKILMGARRKESYLELQVIDNGIGMPKELLENVFEEFTQGQNSPELHDGFGLGLNIAKSLSQAIGGDVYIYSKPNHGTLCSLQIPITSHQIS